MTEEKQIILDKINLLINKRTAELLKKLRNIQDVDAMIKEKVN